MARDNGKNEWDRAEIRGPIPIEKIEHTLDGLLEKGERGAMYALDTIICQAIHHGASDLYLEPWHDCLALRFRLDGQLHPIALIAKCHQEKVIARAKVLSNLVIYQKENPQDGRIEAHPDRLGRAFRASTFPTIYGEKVVIRILDPHRELMQTSDLGFRDKVVTGLQKLVVRPQGTLLLTGPSSSGKTTTIYALLRDLVQFESPSRHIVTIEDPVEYQLGRIGQSQVNPNLGFTFQSAFRSLLRQDPDVIMVGEIRDPETARTAVQAGLTGHLVISTIHSGTAAGVFSRLLDMGVEPFLAASSVTGILAQRLVRKNCPLCIESYRPDPIILENYGLSRSRHKFEHGMGCDNCRGIGYRGREAIGELLMVNEEISDLVMTRARTRRLQEAAIRNGMTTLVEDGLEKVIEGVTTIEELQLVVPAPDEEEAYGQLQARAIAADRVAVFDPTRRAEAMRTPARDAEGKIVDSDLPKRPAGKKK